MAFWKKSKDVFVDCYVEETEELRYLSVKPDKPKPMILYFQLVRRFRLANQRLHRKPG